MSKYPDSHLPLRTGIIKIPIYNDSGFQLIVFKRGINYYLCLESAGVDQEVEISIDLYAMFQTEFGGEVR